MLDRLDRVERLDARGLVTILFPSNVGAGLDVWNVSTREGS